MTEEQLAAAWERIDTGTDYRTVARDLGVDPAALLSRMGAYLDVPVRDLLISLYPEDEL